MNFKLQAQESYKAALDIKLRNEGKDWSAEDKAQFEKLVDSALEAKRLSEKEAALETFKRNVEEKFNALPVAAQEELKRKVEDFQKWCLRASQGQSYNEFHGVQTRLHSEGDPSLGGSFVPEDVQNEVIKGLSAFTAIRPLISVKRSKSNPYVVPRLTGDGNTYNSAYRGSWKPEGQGISDNGAVLPTQANPATGLRQIFMKLWAADVVVLTRELLMDSVVNFETELAEIFASTLGLDLDSAYLNGDGILQPRGIMTYANAGITQVDVGTTTDITYDGLLALFAALPQQYRKNAVFIMNSATYTNILGITGTSNDHPIFTPNQDIEAILKKPVIISEFMPNIGNGNFPILFGDLRYYRGVDRMDMEVIRYVEKYAPHIGLQPYARFGGDVDLMNAFRVGVTN